MTILHRVRCMDLSYPVEQDPLESEVLLAVDFAVDERVSVSKDWILFDL